MFHENACTFYDRQIILLNIVKVKLYYLLVKDFGKLTKSSYTNQINSGKWLMVAKIRKSKFCYILIPWSGSLAVGQKIHHCSNYY